MRSAVKEWVRKAEADFEVASILGRKKKKTVYGAVCFHAQQCAEKYLKAFLTAQRKKFPKTHNLTNLLSLAAQIDPSLNLIHDLVKGLSPFAVEFRYPGEDATGGEAIWALKAAAEVRSVLRSKLV